MLEPVIQMAKVTALLVDNEVDFRDCENTNFSK